MSIKNLLFLSSLSMSFSALAEVRFPEIPSKNQPLYLSLQTEFFRSQANYTNFGQHVDLSDNDYFQYVSFNPILSYSPFKHYISFSLFANSFYASSGKKDKQHVLPFQVSAVGAGFKLFHKFKSLFFGFELRGALPLYKNFENYQKPAVDLLQGQGHGVASENPIVVGDGAYFVEPSLWLIFRPSKTFYIYNHTAFRWRSTGLSSLLISNLGTVLKSKFISAGLSLDTFFSLFMLDHFSNQKDSRLDILKTGNAGSLKFYSVNPSAISATAWSEFNFKPFFTTLYVNLDTIGDNYAKGFTLGLVTKYRWSTQRSFIHKKRKRNNFLDFEFSNEEENFNPEPKEQDYFEEEDDTSLDYEEEYSRKRKKPKERLNNELRNELNLLNED